MWDYVLPSAVCTVTLDARLSGYICLSASTGQCLCKLNLTERDLNPNPWCIHLY